MVPEPRSSHPAQPVPAESPHSVKVLADMAARAAAPAVVLPWRSRPAVQADDRPFQAPGDRLGAARGLMLGLVVGAVLWVLIGIAIWRVLL